MAKKLAQRALSYASPTEPIEGRIPASRHRAPKASDEGASIRVTAERENRPPRIARLRYVLRVTTDERVHRVELLHRNVTKFGTSFRALAAVCDIAGEIVPEPRAPVPEVTTGVTR